MIKILFVSDTHLGFDDARRPRVVRRRRGHDFFQNFERALAPAVRGEVDLVVHGGDVFYRSRVTAPLVEHAFRPLRAVADAGVPVYLVPGNHERSQIPCGLLAQHERIFVFDRPRTFVFRRDGFALALAGFPYVRHVREKFAALHARTGMRTVEADASLLVMHHCVEGARVGPRNFTFRNGSDVIRAADVPRDVIAVLSGHVHRAQALTRGLAAPVLYAGSIERTSFAEKNETKGFLIVAVETGGPCRGQLRGWRFHELPARPMVQIEWTSRDSEAAFRRKLAQLDPNSVVGVRVAGDAAAWPSASRLRALAPPTMNVTFTRSASGSAPS